jgi:thymidylate kinase
VSLARKQTGRDKYERDLDLLGRVRQSYLRQAKEGQWTVLDAVRDRALVADDVRAAVAPLLAEAAS